MAFFFEEFEKGTADIVGRCHARHVSKPDGPGKKALFVQALCKSIVATAFERALICRSIMNGVEPR